MTTIAYDHKRKQIAVDGRVTADALIVSDSYKKYIETDKGILFYAGALCDTKLLISVINDYDHRELPGLPSEIEIMGILVSDSVYKVFVSEGVLLLDEINYSDAAGSGESFALAALDHGKTARKAVEYAMTRDCYTGGRVSVYDIKKGAFI